MKKMMGAAALTALLAITGCAQQEASTPKAPVVESAAADSSSTSAPSPTASRSERGNVVKTLGEGAGVTANNGDALVEFSVNAIEIDPGCTSEYATPPENGHFIVLDVAMQTFPELADATEIASSYSLSPHDMKVVAPNGTTSNASLATGSAYMCLANGEQFPSSLGPAEKAQGKIVLDSEVPSGVLVIGNYGAGGWEYSF